jgi:muconate cycloisomerase
MKVIRAEILEVDIPFKLTFKHSLHDRSESNSVLVCLRSDSGEVGWGESLPRQYVTGETVQSVVETIRDHFLPIVLKVNPASWEAALEIAKNLEVEARTLEPNLPPRIGAARCALELAFLDLAGNHFRRSVAEIFGQRKREWVEYSGVISSDSRWKVAKTAFKMRLGALRAIKIKVGGADDREKLKLVRALVGARIDLRVDANAAWNVSDAIGKIQTFKQYGISSVEQPVRADDYEGLQAVTSAVSTPVMVDESLCTLADAKKLVAMDACDSFNIRLSKCGGLFASLELAEFARNYDKGCQLGCQVGETAILSAAVRHFAMGIAGLKYFEGSYGTHLLQQDIARENLTFRRGGVGHALKGPGLGIHVLPERIEPYVLKRHEVNESR